MRFPIYEHLCQLNRNLQETVEILERIRQLPRINKKRFGAYQVEIEFLRAEACQDIAEIMDAIESEESHQFWLKKQAYEKSISDPDDIYFDVIQREAERRKKGLPPRLEIVRGELTIVEGKGKRNNKRKEFRRKMSGQNRGKGKHLRQATTKR
jgi:hypothetical protein